MTTLFTRSPAWVPWENEATGRNTPSVIVCTYIDPASPDGLRTVLAATSHTPTSIAILQALLELPGDPPCTPTPAADPTDDTAPSS
jgi:hypothetical protein